jgi:ribonuclease BN (tRNA processing enzyme)
MSIRFIGVGSQASDRDQYHSNMVFTSPAGKRMLIDCGGDARFALAECGIQPQDLDAVYVSHLHSDHVGGMEWLALSTYFAKESRRLALFAEKELLSRLWNNSLRGGLECIRLKRMQLADYFDCQPLTVSTPFYWEGIRFEMVEMLHIAGEQCNLYSYGLLIQYPSAVGTSLFVSTDAVFQPELLNNISPKADLIFHDCETSPYRTGVHAHYEELCSLSATIKDKIWLYHYQANPAYQPQADGFQGFVVKGQEFSYKERC